ncbi:MAG: hypothetical protein OEY47_04350 [Candidatus Bathyarchaeota archaeon]|nr:hypothetical protein [Candidatus Bathyarchaeota archaeon]MDH5635878.1 hypothetical protein [Candidatus Bathyarchaeota archaeon]
MEVRHPEVVPKVSNEAPKAVPETLVLNLFDIDPCIEPERPRRIDLDLDQLEDEE